MGGRFLMWGIGFVGVVTVAYGVAVAPGDTPRSRTAEAPVQCRGSAALDFRCYERRYTQMVVRDGPRATLRELSREQRRNGHVRAACHQLTHRIGRAAGKLRGLDALSDGNSVCVSGFYHGVLQAVMSKLGARGATEQADGICAEPRAADRRSAEHYNCVHGMGHGYMEVFSSDVFESLAGCRSLADPWEEDECAGGVFMENVTAIDNRHRPSRYLRLAEPLYPCTVVRERLWEQCYDWQITYALYVNDSDFAKVFELCAAGVRAARAPCYRGLGGDALQQSKFATVAAGRRAAMRHLCALGPSRAARTHCVEGIVRNMFRDYVDGDLQARALCRSLTHPRELQAACVRMEARARNEIPLPKASFS